MMSEHRIKEKARQLANVATKEFTDKGLIIEAGWQSLRIMAIPENAHQTQIDEMRNAFFCGAQHLFASIMSVLDPGEEPTEKDFERMDLIHKELDRFIKDYEFKHFTNPRGSA
jgi:hypothetical protein